MTDADSTAVFHALAPTGVLRAGINLGNPVIAQRDHAGALHGIGPALARELARRVGVHCTFVTYDTAGKLADAVRTQAWDVAFLAVDPERAVDIDFTAPYLLIEGTYMVRAGAPYAAIGEVDRPGVAIAVGAKTAYDLFLSRTLQHATLVRAPSSRAAIERFLAGEPDVVAGVKQPLAEVARSTPGLEVLAGHFMVIRQAAAVPKDRTMAHGYVSKFIEDMKSSGFAAEALRASGVEGAAIAPAEETGIS